jgi:hypothetical protein
MRIAAISGSTGVSAKNNTPSAIAIPTTADIIRLVKIILRFTDMHRTICSLFILLSAANDQEMTAEICIYDFCGQRSDLFAGDDSISAAAESSVS